MVKVDRIVPWLEVAASVAVIVTAIFLWEEVSLIKQSIERAHESGDRPALLFLQSVDVSVANGRDGGILRFDLEVRNQGSGPAYNIQWREASQIPPLYSSLGSKKEAFSSFNSCKTSFPGEAVDKLHNMVIGPGLSQKMQFDHELAFPRMHGEMQVKKYFAAFYESEMGRENCSIVGVLVRLRAAVVLSVVVEEIAICEDPRRKTGRG